MRVEKDKLRVVQPGDVVPVSPRKLGREGQALWRLIHEDYRIDDVAGRTMLAIACEALDRVADCSQQIAKDGIVVRVKGGGIKDHPALRHELANRSLVIRTLARLGLDAEPIKSVGRPPKHYGISTDAD
jgi:P27 family predicted phage terminase small subunit